MCMCVCRCYAGAINRAGNLCHRCQHNHMKNALLPMRMWRHFYIPFGCLYMYTFIICVSFVHFIRNFEEKVSFMMAFALVEYILRTIK